MKEELTTKMHSEFQVSKEIDTKHRVFSFFIAVKGISDPKAQKGLMTLYRVTLVQVQKYKEEYKKLSKHR